MKLNKLKYLVVNIYINISDTFIEYRNSSTSLFILVVVLSTLLYHYHIIIIITIIINVIIGIISICITLLKSLQRLVIIIIAIASFSA